MCPKPDIKDPTKYQTAKAPVFRDGQEGSGSRGRRGTILTGTSNIDTTATSGKKTLLGQ